MQGCHQVFRTSLPILLGLVCLGRLHPALSKQVFGFWMQVADHTVGKSCAHTIGHVAITNDPRGRQDRRTWITHGGAFQLLAKGLPHSQVADLIQPIHQQQHLTFGETIEDHSKHHLGFLRLKF